MNKTLTKALLPLCAAVAVSCASTPDRGWSVSSPTIAARTVIGLGAEAEGSAPATIASAYLGDDVELRGSARRVDGSDGAEAWEIELEEISYFRNWTRGWTEAKVEAVGTLRLTRTAGAWRAEVLEKPAIGSVRSAKARYMDSFLSDDQALRAVANRMERIKAATAFRREGGDDAWFVRPEKKTRFFGLLAYPGYAEAYGPLFFPERYGYPPETGPVGPWKRGDDISWDTGYTRAVFPERLREVRDSGTLYRDWEEAIGLWFLADQWTTFWERAFPAAETVIESLNGENK
jgi:hypothetical protein